MRNARFVTICMFFLVDLAAVLYGYAEPAVPSKRVQLIINETYIDSQTGQLIEGVASPLDKALIERLLGYANLQIVTPEAATTINSDYTLSIKMDFRALGISYSYSGFGLGTYYYMGTSISGELSFVQSDSGLTQTRTFSGTVSPPYSIRVGDYSTFPWRAPFGEAIKSSDFTERLVTVLGEALGPDFWVSTLNDKDKDVRGCAARGLGTRGNIQAVEPLIKTLKDEASFVRWAVATALGSIGDVRAVEPLIRILKDDNNWFVRYAAAEALGEIGDIRAVEPLIGILKDDSNWSVHMQAAEALVRTQAAEALGEISDIRAVEPLIEVLQDQDEDAAIRGTVATVLGKIGDVRALEPLIGILKDSNWFLRGQAADALGEIGDLGAVEPLLGALQDEDPSVRASAAEALGKIGDARTVGPLIRTMKNENFYSVQQSIVEALQRLTLQSIGEDYGAWAAWWEQNKGKY